MHARTTSRRNFIKTITATGAVAGISSAVLTSESFAYASPRAEGNGYTFLFQGDSITDGNRTRNKDWNHVMGHGYQYIISSKLWYDQPAKNYHFFNRGISGNKITDLAARWQADTLDLKPDVLSILVGINDTSVFIDGKPGFTAEQYEKDYRLLLQQTKEQLPKIELILCEPFILPVGKVKDRWEQYFSELKKRQQSVKRLAVEFNAVFVPFQQAFNAALSKAPAEYWIWDGVHPMPAGHELMAVEWMRHVKRKLKFIK